MEIAYASIAGDIRLSNLSQKSIERLRWAFSLRNPTWVQQKVFFKSRKPTADEYLEFMTEYPDGTVGMQRGSISRIRDVLARDGIELVFAKNDMAEGLPLPTCKPVELRDYQAEGVEALAKRGQGVIVLPCGGGKTRLAIGLIERLKRKTLVVVPTEDLLEQWRSECEKLLGIPCGYVADSKFEDGPIVVAMVRTLGNLLVEHRELMNSFGLFIVDEAHRVPARSYQQILPYCPAKYRLALTATPEREDDLDPLIFWSFGDRIYEVEAVTLAKRGFLVIPRLEVVETDFEFSFDGPPHRKNTVLNQKLRESSSRNHIIATIAHREALRGEFVVVLSNDTKHCRTLGKAIWDLGTEPMVLTGEDQSKSYKELRRKTIERMRLGELHVIVATSILDEGIDVQCLSRVIMAGPQRTRRGTAQRTGRLMRPYFGKDPILYDIVDSKVQTLVDRFDERKTIYRRLGMNVPRGAYAF